MPPPTKNLACTLVDIPLKRFVKEKNNDDDTAAEPGSEHKFKLEFKADEAKLVYEEIISHESKKKSISSDSHTLPKHCKQINAKSVDTINRVEKNIPSINTLFKAIEIGDSNFISEYFNSRNVNVTDQFGWTPLMSAAYSGRMEIVDFFLKLNANIKAIDKSGYTAIDLARKNNHHNIVDTMKKHIRANNRRNKIVNSSKDSPDKESSDKQLDQKGFYCNVCQHYFMESSQSVHESSTLHVFNNKPKLRNTFYGIPKQNKGYQMLLNTGWQEDSGLGPSGEGKKYPIKTVLKRDRRGFGQKNDKNARITHFKAGDAKAINFVYMHKRKFGNKKEWERERKRDIAKTRILRQALS